ncbi:MAG TPA: hypothetical protein ENN06_01445 [Desulfobacteraceae bacterium]|nr:hypothetical protein [Desulfobacteraceae bacterium]
MFLRFSTVVGYAGLWTTLLILLAAKVITMFFLLTYGTINLACFYESITRNPSFRPTFKMNHWFLALIGTLSCLAVMFLISTLWAVIAIVLAAGMFLLIERAEIVVQWGDLTSGMAFQRARKAILRLEKERYHPKNWRPSILALSGNPKKPHPPGQLCLPVIRRPRHRIPRTNQQWRDCPLRILRTVPPKADVENVTAEMRETLSAARIRADIVVLPTENPIRAVRQAMQPSAVLFAGIEPADPQKACPLLSSMQEVVNLPGDVILVCNAGDVSLSA